MSRKFDATVDVALEIERELRALSGDKPSIRGWVQACLSRGGLVYEDIEAVKERLGSDFLQTRMVDPGAYCRHLRRYTIGGSVKEPPAADRIQRMIFAKRDGAVAELGGEPKMLFTLVAIVAERVYQEKPELFGGIDDIDTHRARLAELEAKRKELYAAFPSTWTHGDLHIGRITSDGAALITFAKAPGEVPVHPPETAGERLVDHLLEQERAGISAEAA
jgi:hypothetical protein